MSAKAVAPWVRTRLRTAPGAAGALALLVLLTAFLAAALPRGIDRYEDRGLRHAVTSAAPDNTVIRVSGPVAATPVPGSDLTSDKMAQGYAELLRTIPAPLRPDRGQSAYGVRTTEKILSDARDTWLARPEGLPPRFFVDARSAPGDHTRLVSGRLPTARAAASSATAEAAVTKATADALHITPGSVIHVKRLMADPLALRITGIVEPLRPSATYWAAEPVLREPEFVLSDLNDRDSPHYWYAGLLLGPDAAPALAGAAGKPEVYTDIAPDPRAMNARQLGGLKSALASLKGGPALADIRAATDGGTQLMTQLDAVLTLFTSVRDSITPVVAVATFGTATVAGVVLLMAGGLAAARRTSELALLRARGGSLRGIAGRLTAETAVVAVPAAALGLALAVWAVPTGRIGPSLLAVATVTAVSCLALPVRAVLAHRTVRSAERDDLVRVTPSRRRTVAELTLLVLAVGAVVALRRRSTAAGSDALVSSAPVLVGVIAALVLVRLYPLPLRWAARPAARLRSTVGFLSLARAGRAPGGGVLPLLALLTALTTAAFGGSVLAGVADARDRAALYTTGADARIDSVGPLPPALPGRVAKAPGVSSATPAHVEYGVEMPYGDRVAVIGADPDSYARLTARTGLGSIRADALRTAAGSGPATSGAPRGVLPAIASPKVAAGLGKGPRKVRVAGYDVTVEVVAVRTRTPAVPQSDFLVLDGSALGTKYPTTVLITGPSVDGRALRELVRTAAGPHPHDPPSVQLRKDTRRQLTDSPLQTGAEDLYTAAVAAGAGFAALALLLSLLRGAPERAALLARLRTMGLTRGQGRRLLILEALPQAVLAAVGGVLTGWAATELLAPGVDLAGLALAASPATAAVTAELRADPLSLALPAACVVALAAGVAATQAWWTSRRGSITELRAGDTR